MAKAGEEITSDEVARNPWRVMEFLSAEAARSLGACLPAPPRRLEEQQLEIAEGILKAWRIMLSSEPETPQPKPEPDRMLKVAEAAMRIGIARDTLYRNADDYPFTRRPRPRALRFSERGIEEWLRERAASRARVRNSSGATGDS